MKHPVLSDLQDYFENALGPAVERRIRQHVSECDQCTKILADFATIETKVKSFESPQVSQNTEARILIGASELLRKKRELAANRRDYGLLVKEWKENIFPELRVPALQLCSVSLMIAAFIAVEQGQSLEESIYEPLSHEVKVYEGEDKV